MPPKLDEVVQAEIASNSKKFPSTYQSKLFSLPLSTKRARSDGQGVAATKKLKVDYSSENIEEESGNVATTTDSSKLLPVTRDAFLNKYRVAGLQDTYYQEDWIDAKTANRWHNELKNLPQWYRPKLKVYGKEIQQSRSIAGEI